jgi:hypothetical protein
MKRIYKIGNNVAIEENSIIEMIIPTRSLRIEPEDAFVCISDFEIDRVINVPYTAVQNQAGTAVGAKAAVIAYLTAFVSSENVASSGGGGSGGDASAANQITTNVNLGATNDAAATSDTGTFSLISLIKRLLVKLQSGIFTRTPNVTTSGTLTALASEVILDVPDGMSSCNTHVTGNFNGVMQFFASTNGVDFSPAVGVLSGVGTIVSFFQVNGIYRSNVSAFKKFKVVVTQYSSGTANITFEASAAVGATFLTGAIPSGNNVIGAVNVNDRLAPVAVSVLPITNGGVDIFNNGANLGIDTQTYTTNGNSFSDLIGDISIAAGSTLSFKGANNQTGSVTENLSWNINGVEGLGDYTAATTGVFSFKLYNPNRCPFLSIRTVNVPTGAGILASNVYLIPSQFSRISTPPVQPTADISAGATAGGTPATRSSLAGGIFNTSPPTLTNGQQAAHQFDVNGNLKISDNTASGYLIGQVGQTAAVNNILTAPSGASPNDWLLYNSATVTVVSTATGGTYIFEGSNDLSSGFAPLTVKRFDLTTGAVISAAITASNSTITYEFAVKFRYIRLRVVTALTGGSIQAFSRLNTTPYAPDVVRVANSNAGDLNVTLANSTNAGTVGTQTLRVVQGNRTETQTGSIGTSTDIALPAGQRIRSLLFTNNTAAVVFLQVFNKTSALVANDVPLNGLIIRVPANTTVDKTVADYGESGILYGTNTHIGLSSAQTVYTPIAPAGTNINVITVP